LGVNERVRSLSIVAERSSSFQSPGPGGVAEQRTKRDLVGIGQLGEPPCDRFVEPDTAFVDELGRGRGNEGAVI
jgi:hypothetical protein